VTKKKREMGKVRDPVEKSILGSSAYLGGKKRKGRNENQRVMNF